ncbi:hypothetical protein BDU57DRAFT_517593 [Ampelomyces quisqualis]|uniref:Ribosomal protein/NADH dehydrogenase domain-containing protein n=1 Tax=Ampelomyces quisqualis TaxID=50730 RepID=A0A6A5QN78_AMPQU|nr:hypothetical protein BDU57DRAFT_517593 [Ampelomyces quisqualis]
MVNIVKRMRKLRELLWIRCGPGALILPKEVSKISMEFNHKFNGGHLGARRFWRTMLPRIKFRNPSVPITIARHHDPDGPSLLHIYMRSPNGPLNTQTPASPSATPNAQTTLVPDTSAPTHTLNIRSQTESQILEQLVKTLDVQQIEATPEEKEEMAQLEEQRVRSERVRAQVREHFLAQRREEQLLKLARGEKVTV